MSERTNFLLFLTGSYSTVICQLKQASKVL